MKKIVRIVFALALILFPFMLFAQIIDESHPSTSGVKPIPTNNDPMGAPIEDGIGILMIVSAAFIAKKTYVFLKSERHAIS